MKKVHVLSVLAVGLMLVAGMVTAGIDGSKHDFEATAWTDEICEACHTPHNGNTSFVAPLWNHVVTSATYTLYSSATLNGTKGQPGDVSKACLSCHDGTVAVDSFGGSTGSTYITGNANFSTDLSNDHPIGITYETGAGTEMKNTISIAAVQLWDSKVECASCHDLHNTAGNSYLLVNTNTGSALCLACHDK